jgi:hypothetical protein
VTVLVDDARWWAHGRRWCHLASDASIEEMHAFAERVGIARRAFHGDHYDVPAERRADVVAAGAVPVDSRTLLRGLTAAGLRRSPRERRAAQTDAGITPTNESAGPPSA